MNGTDMNKFHLKANKLPDMRVETTDHCHASKRAR